MNCLACAHDNRPSAKFCEACAAPLVRTCSGCGSELRATARFCDECGRAVGAEVGDPPPRRAPRDYTPKHLADKILQSKSALEGERKQVTVLFADVKGSNCVHKETADGGIGGVVACHDSEGKAQAQLRALYANESQMQAADRLVDDFVNV